MCVSMSLQNHLQLPRELQIRIVALAGRDARLALNIKPGKLRFRNFCIPMPDLYKHHSNLITIHPNFIYYQNYHLLSATISSIQQQMESSQHGGEVLI